jgi:protein arginine kinase activator
MYDLFSDFFNMMDPFVQTNKAAQSAKICPGCGHTWNDFRRTGRFGCAECYKTFRNEAASTIRQIHSTTKHTGKVPSKAGEGLKRRREYDSLKQQLQQAVRDEDYETAAKLHKQIREMEKEGI